MYRSIHFAVYPDRIVEGNYTARAISANEIASTYPREKSQESRPNWKLLANTARYPQLHSSLPILNATYNLSLEELTKDIRPDGALMAGAQWEGVWTRDISYSILLSLAAIEPDVAKHSLMQKVKRGRIVQDTGTGGSWPVSSDRMVWALAAWEIYKTTGDRAWLRQSYDIIRDSAKDDETAVVSPDTGLVYGESSFLDWREQTYPRWMQPADIYESQALGTNAVHYQTNKILSRMAQLLGDSGAEYERNAERIRSAMNLYLWDSEKGYYGQYLYGREWKTLSPRAEALGEALVILFDIADREQQKAMIHSVPLMEYGIPCIYPQTPGLKPYHNQATWPFVQAFWNLSAAKNRDTAMLLWGMSAMLRHSALFQTNKENLVVDTGEPFGTAINSDRQLWSVAGNLAMVYRVLFGLSFEEDGLHLNPVVPKSFAGHLNIENFHYRDAVLSLEVKGHGSRVRYIKMDGNALRHQIPATLKGRHKVVIVMEDDATDSSALEFSKNRSTVEMPIVAIDGDRLHWQSINGATSYKIIRDGQLLARQQNTELTVPNLPIFHEYQVSAIDADGVESFLSEPVGVRPDAITVVPFLSSEAETAAEGELELTREKNTLATVHFKIATAGRYRVQLRYANGSGPINTDNKCALRTLYVDGHLVGKLVLPQRGLNEWSNRGLSNALRSQLSEGDHLLEIRFESHDENMNPDVNQALVNALVFKRVP